MEVSDLRGVMISAYKNTDGKLVVVMINFLDETRNVSLAASDNASRTFVPLPYLGQQKPTIYGLFR